MFRIVLKRLPVHKNIIKSNIGLIRYSTNILRSDFPDVTIPNTTLPEHIFSNFSKFPNNIALECAATGRKYTFEQVRRKSINLNKALRKILKLQQGDVTAVILPNIPEYPICILGSLLANLKVTTVNPHGTVEEIRRQIVDTNAKAIFTTCSLEIHVRQLLKTLPLPVPVIAVKTEVTDTIPQGFINFSEVIDVTFDIDDRILTTSKDIAIIPYSSGTTGLQKGVLIAHYTAVALAQQLTSPYMDFTKPTTENFQDLTPVILPFFHIYGLTSLLTTQLYALVKLVTVSKFTPDIFLNVLKRYKPRVLCVVPPLVLFLLNNPSVTTDHLNSIEYIISGAAPLGCSEEEKLEKKSGGKSKVIQGYGLTEASVISSNFNNGKLGTVGRPLQNTEVKIVPINDVLGKPLEQYQEGEVFARGPQVMVGYHNNPEATENTLIDGWLRTGDLGYYDEHKNLYIKDRLKELIKVQGYQVAPAELEELIRKYPNIDDAVVIGIPDDTLGEVPRAYVTLKANTKIDLKDLEQFVTKNVSKYKRIGGGFSIVDSIPKTATGKYLRKQLKTEYLKNKV